MPEPIIEYILCDKDFKTLERVKTMKGMGASFPNARHYFKERGWRGSFYLVNTKTNVFKNIRISK